MNKSKVSGEDNLLKPGRNAARADRRLLGSRPVFHSSCSEVWKSELYGDKQLRDTIDNNWGRKDRQSEAKRYNTVIDGTEKAAIHHDNA